MPLILAIEPDRRQASQLTAMVRGRLHAELVLGDSAERALTALGDRVPDLVLTSALLSPKDETALGDRLRSLDGNAAHVQTLTIPVLATTSGRGGGRASGVLSALRRDKNKPSAPEGCDPAVFAEQCKEYLERAAADRAALLEQAATNRVKEPVRPISPSPVTGAEWVVVREEAPVEPQAAAETAAEPIEAADAMASGQAESMAEFEYVATEPFARNQKAPIYTPPEYRTPAGIIVPEYDATAGQDDAPDSSVEAEQADAAPSAIIEPTVVEPRTIAAPEADADPADHAPRVDRVLKEFLDLTSADSEGPASLLAAVAALEAEEQSYVAAHAPVFERPAAEPPAAEPPAAEPAPVETLPAETLPVETLPDEQPAHMSDFLDLSSLLQPLPSASETPAYNGDDASVDVYEIDPKTLGGVERLATLTDLEDIFKNTPEFAVPAPTPAPAVSKPAPINELENLKEWDDIVEALRRDAERLETPRPAHTDDTLNAAFASEPIDLPPVVVQPAPPAPAAAPIATPPAQPAGAVPQEEADAGGVDSNGAKRKRKRPAKASPAQDEWGFFDPDQCGFAALIEKLEEIKDKDDTPAPRGA